jgi:hypothetical protein
VSPEFRRVISNNNPKFSFVFVRHPEARVVSAWRNKVYAPPRTPAQAKLMERSPGLAVGMGLNDFIEWLAEAFQRGPVDKHWRRQSDYVCDRQGRTPDPKDERHDNE